MRIQDARRLAAGALAFLILLPARISGQTSAPAARPAAQAARWITHKDAQHYSVETPPGWTAWPDKEKGWVHLLGTQGEDVVVWPVFVPGQVDQRLAPSIHARLAEACPYRSNWGAATVAARNVIRSEGSLGEMAAVSLFTWMPTPRGLAGFFYVTAARRADYRQKQGDFARILQSFRIMGAPSPPASNAIQYVQFRDPNEGAFTTEVPSGWKTQGGLFRFNALDYRPSIETFSPDGKIRILIGDAQIPPYTDMTGMPVYFPEGTVYAPGGFSTISRRFTTGTLFCREYVSTRIPQACANVQITEAKDRPDLLQELVASDPALRTFSVATIGDVSFRCGSPDQPMVGLCRALTAGVSMGNGGGPWKVHALNGYLSAPEKSSLAYSIMEHIGKNMKVTPEWARMQIQLEGKTSQIMSRTANEIADMAAAGQRSRDAVRDEMDRRRSNAIRGTVDVADPATGRRVSVESGSNYYWVDQGGLVVGTNTDTRPGIDFRPLVQLP